MGYIRIWVEMARAEITMMFGKKPDGAKNRGMTKYSFLYGAHGVAYFERGAKIPISGLTQFLHHDPSII